VEGVFVAKAPERNCVAASDLSAHPARRTARMEKKWRVGDLQPVLGAAKSQVGFVLYDEAGHPCVTFGYGSHDEAGLARQYVMAALIGVETVRGLRQSDR
jgi:hypothetical protein